MDLAAGQRTRRAGGAGVVALVLAVVAGLAPTAAATAWPPPSYVEPLSEIAVRGGRIGWDGLYVGMTFAEVERSFGRLDRPEASPGLLCPFHRTEITIDGLRLGLDFSGTGREAALRAITVPLVPRIGETFESSVVVAALRSRLDLAFVASPHAPHLGEGEVEKPLFRTRHDELVFVNPESGVVIGEVCVD